MCLCLPAYAWLHVACSRQHGSSVLHPRLPRLSQTAPGGFGCLLIVDFVVCWGEEVNQRGAARGLHPRTGRLARDGKLSESLQAEDLVTESGLYRRGAGRVKMEAAAVCFPCT